jgi:pimeloyl-ACP methyl ester carboxylesterase
MPEQSFSVDGFQVHCDVRGQGPDVLFIHGWVASRRMWAHLTAGLADSFRCWAIDLPGCGDSDKPPDVWYTIPNFTASLRGFMRAAGINRARLVGHSMGGAIVLDFAAEHPELVERLVAVNPVVSGRSNLRLLARQRVSRPLLGLSLHWSPRVLQPVLNASVLDGVAGVHSIRRRTQDFARGTVDSIFGSARAVMTHDGAPRLPAVTAPTLVLLGNQDVVVPNAEGRLAAARIPGARLEVMRAGHLVTDDRPAETLALLRSFLA